MQRRYGRCENVGRFIVAFGFDQRRKRGSGQKFHEQGFGGRVIDLGGALSAVPGQQDGAPDFLIDAGLEEFERGVGPGFESDAIDGRVRRLGDEDRAGESPADHRAAQRGFGGRLVDSHHQASSTMRCYPLAWGAQGEARP